MSVTIRIKHKKDPARPEAVQGLIEILVNGDPIALPMKGYDKVIREQVSPFQIFTEVTGDED